MSRQFCHSETGARGKFCPFVRPEFIPGDVFDGIPYCIASECMAWRWVDTHVQDETGEMVKSQNTHGYCGLAGQPWEPRS